MEKATAIRATRNTQAGGHPIIEGKQYAIGTVVDPETTIGPEDAKALVRIGKAEYVNSDAPDLAKMNVEQLKALATERGITFDAAATKKQLIELLTPKAS